MIPFPPWSPETVAATERTLTCDEEVYVNALPPTRDWVDEEEVVAVDTVEVEAVEVLADVKEEVSAVGVLREVTYVAM